MPDSYDGCNKNTQLILNSLEKEAIGEEND
jgi:hypothetical protein